MADDRTALIIGGSGGIGSHVVEAFFEHGYRVIYTYNSKKGDYGQHESEQLIAKRLNILLEDDIHLLREWIMKEYQKLDVLVYCSGVFEDALISNMEAGSWDRVMDINLKGPFLCAKHFTDLLRQSGHGRFLCIGSVMGDLGAYGSSSYAAAKAGLIGFVKSMALENATKQVTANVVSLGYIDTGMTHQLSEKILEAAKKKIPMKKLGNPDKLGNFIVGLCSDTTDYLSGQVIRYNGLLYV